MSSSSSSSAGHQTSLEVTSIASSKKRGDRFDVRAGRHVLATLSWDDIEKLEITTGTIWNEELATRAEELMAVDEAFRAAARLLERRPLAERDLAFRLKRKDHSERAIQGAVERLKERGFINDEVCARQWIDHFLRSKPAGRRMLEQKLRAKFLDGELVRRLLSEMLDQESEEGMARRVAEKKWRSLRQRDAQGRAAGLYRYLAGRGFNADLCRRMVNEMASNEADEADEGDDALFY